MTGRLVERAALSCAQRGEMLTLLRSHFEGVKTEKFERDLAEKSWVILVEDARRRIRGFSTLMLWQRFLLRQGLDREHRCGQDGNDQGYRGQRQVTQCSRVHDHLLQ